MKQGILKEALPSRFLSLSTSISSMVENEKNLINTCICPIEELFTQLNANLQRLSTGEVEQRLSKYGSEEIYPLINMIKGDLFEEVERLNSEGFRVLGIACREFPKYKKNLQ